MSSADQAIYKGHSRIKEVATCLGLKEACISKAMQMFKQVADNGSLRGRCLDAKVATVIFMASRFVD